MTGFDLTRIKDGSDRLLAMILKPSADSPVPVGVQFLTEPVLSQQVAVIAQPTGHTIPRHAHLLSPREIQYTQETLFLVKGRLRVDIYDTDRVFVGSWVCGPGEVIVLVSGGHGFHVMEKCLMVEVKQGPFDPAHDKERF